MTDVARTLRDAKVYINKSLTAESAQDTQQFRFKAIGLLSGVLDKVDITEYLLIDTEGNADTVNDTEGHVSLTKEEYLHSLFTLGTLYKTYTETDITLNAHTFLPRHDTYFKKAIDYFVLMLRVTVKNELASTQLTSIFTQICYYRDSKGDTSSALATLQQALFWIPESPVIHYNLAFVYHKLNRLEQSVIHYKLGCTLLARHTSTDTADFELLVSCYTGISGVYRSVKQWPEALYYLLKAKDLKPEDPEVLNQLGVVYTEMRRTDLAEIAYTSGIEHAKPSGTLLADLYMNLGHMHSYNGDNTLAMESYNKSIALNPKGRLAFQNKLMNMTYIFDLLPEGYILEQHKKVNLLFAKGTRDATNANLRSDLINIGFVSGDFVSHPVSFFINSFLKHFDTTRFTVTCYSECVINGEFSNVKYRIIKGMSASQVTRQVNDDNIHILVDLSGHTALNRLDVFALRAAKVQVSYIGYPYSTGLTEMDYRITDTLCDNLEISQPMYTERLVQLPGCFLCYTPGFTGDPAVTCTTPGPHPCPFLRSSRRKLTIGCFNRLNKINDKLIDILNKLLYTFPEVHLIFKTKALINKTVRAKFLAKFNSSFHQRIIVLDCTISHEAHMATYNDIDIAIDTFPYSGTTTSCEALWMGVPVITMYDTVNYFHAQNVTASILLNTSPVLEKFVCKSVEDVVSLVGGLLDEPDEFYRDLKNTTKDLFRNGPVCDGPGHTRRLEELFTQLHTSGTHT
ncbi:hypothetical protein EBZ39_04010 [bacterium]|nr:hypothetical protein [bacterium]